MKHEESVDRVIQVKNISIGGNIRALREQAGFRQSDFVKKLQIEGIDISVYSYNRIEKGTQNPTVSFLLASCRLLHCDMNAIFDIE